MVDSRSLYTYRAAAQKVTTSGSKWGLTETEVFRIRYRDVRDPCWPSSPLSSALSQNRLWADFIDANTDGILSQTHKEMRIRFGVSSEFFIALANVLRQPSFLSSESARETRQLLDPPSPQSLNAIIGSRSTSGSSSGSSPYNPLPDRMDIDVEEERELKQPEVARSSLAAQFISLVIDVFLDQSPAPQKRLAFRESPTKFILTNRDETVDCKCLDDGAIIWHKWDPLFQQWMSSEHVCSVETKPGFIQGNEEGKGRISSEMIPQYACEMIGAVLAQSIYEKRPNVNHWQPLIVTHSCYFTILSATFPPTYLKYIAGAGNELDGDPAFLEIHCTKTHDLKTSVGRRNAAKDLLTLCEKLLGDDRDEEVGDAL